MTEHDKHIVERITDLIYSNGIVEEYENNKLLRIALLDSLKPVFTSMLSKSRIELIIEDAGGYIIDIFKKYGREGLRRYLKGEPIYSTEEPTRKEEKYPRLMPPHLLNINK